VLEFYTTASVADLFTPTSPQASDSLCNEDSIKTVKSLGDRNFQLPYNLLWPWSYVQSYWAIAGHNILWSVLVCISSPKKNTFLFMVGVLSVVMTFSSLYCIHSLRKFTWFFWSTPVIMMGPIFRAGCLITCLWTSEFLSFSDLILSFESVWQRQYFKKCNGLI
jgi:hypothetical protein